MKEQIHAQTAYKGYVVPTQSRGGDYAEDRLANMSAIIVEVGFHTNPSDAAALQDPIFRTAAMKGVEKGYRLYTQGKGCEVFDISSIADVSSPADNFVPVQVNFKGYPQFPVTYQADNVSCPAGGICTGSTQIIDAPSSSPLQIMAHCGDISTASTSRWKATLTDADGVSTQPAEYNLTCMPSNQKTPSNRILTSSGDTMSG